MRAHHIESLITTVVEAKEEAPRNYLGISSWGDSCERRMWYKSNQTPGKQRKARFHTIAQMGHKGEEIVQDMLERAGFTVTGQQTTISDYKDSLGGHCDGILAGGPACISYPALWECKFKGQKYWKEIDKKGVQEAEPEYYVQLHCYMGYLKLSEALFTAVNRDTGEIYCEVVQFDPAIASHYQERAVRVCDATHPDELGRVSNDQDSWQCKWCDYRETCYGI